MPVIISTLWGALVSIAGTLVGRVMAALGMGLITYIGFGNILSELTAFGNTALTSLPDNLKQIFGLLRLGECFSMIVGTVTVKMVMHGLANGSIKRIGVK